jgi:hypothetical protein
MTKILLALLTLAMTGAASRSHARSTTRTFKRIGSATTDSSGLTTNYDARGKINA